MAESEEEKKSKRSISMPVSMWDFLEKCAARTTQKNLSRMLQLLVEKEQRAQSTRYTWTDYSVHLVEEPGFIYHTEVFEKMNNEGITQPQQAASEDTSAKKPTPTPPGSKPTGDH